MILGKMRAIDTNHVITCLHQMDHVTIHIKWFFNVILSHTNQFTMIISIASICTAAIINVCIQRSCVHGACNEMWVGVIMQFITITMSVYLFFLCLLHLSIWNFLQTWRQLVSGMLLQFLFQWKFLYRYDDKNLFLFLVIIKIVHCIKL